MSINFHKRIGLKPGFGFVYENFGAKKVFGMRLYWSLLDIVV